jgi:hypothetical protein
MDETQRLAEQLGGSCQTAIAADTDYVVACGTTLEDAGQLVCNSVARNAASTSTSENTLSNSTSPEHSLGAEHAVTAKPTAARGIRLLSERQFVALLPGGKAQFK